MMDRDSLKDLSVDERLDLIDAIWETLDDEQVYPLSTEQKAELDRRIAAADADADTTMDWRALRDQTKARLDASRQVS